MLVIFIIAFVIITFVIGSTRNPKDRDLFKETYRKKKNRRRFK